MALKHAPNFQCRMCGEYEVYQCQPCDWSWCEYCGAGNTCPCEREEK